MSARLIPPQDLRVRDGGGAELRTARPQAGPGGGRVFKNLLTMA